MGGDYGRDNTDTAASYKLKTEACEKGSGKERKLRDVTINYLCVCLPRVRGPGELIDLCRYRYGTLIVFANYLIEMKEKDDGAEASFPDWLREHREIARLLSRRSLD